MSAKTVDAGVIAERPFGAQVGVVDVAFEHELGARRNLEVDRSRLDQFDRLAAQEPGERELIEHRRQRRGCGVGQHRIAADRDGNRNLLAPRIGVRAPLFVTLPVHAGLAFVVDLHAIHADVGTSGARIVGDHERQRDERSAVERPGGEHGKFAQIGFAHHDVLARGIAHGLRNRVGKRRKTFERVELFAPRAARR